MDFKEQLGQLNASLNHSINFVLNKLADFPGLSLGEQISYPAIKMVNNLKWLII
ncbi:hypothetical protein J4479_05880 [Candidatus Woesearchaeota archaeon]|nr:hypothetical protein [Candidatus Woesearchaeota archaeon]